MAHMIHVHNQEIHAVSTFHSAAIVGGGLAGCECAHKLSQAGIAVTLFEMKPHRYSAAHNEPELGELVCSNSLRSDEPEAGVGVLKQEMRILGSLVLQVAKETQVPAGKALAVDRTLFRKAMTRAMEKSPEINVIRREIMSLDDPVLAPFDVVIIAAGPLASESLSTSLAETLGASHLYFYDAIAPIIQADSVNMDKAFWGSRYRPEDTDYLNCPMGQEEYHTLCSALIHGRKAPTKNFEKEVHFEGCMPIETLAERGEMTLAFGPFKPVGLDDPRTGQRPFAVVQLRAENINKSMFNLVGCQTKLTYDEQDRIFRMIPGLEHVEFVRYGSVHRNTYVNAPKTLAKDQSLKARPHIFLAGQITGVEGYVESAANGMWLGMMLAARKQGHVLPPLPRECALGALAAHLSTEAKTFQPSNINFGLTPALNRRAPKKMRKLMYAQRAQEAFAAWYAQLPKDMRTP